MKVEPIEGDLEDLKPTGARLRLKLNHGDIMIMNGEKIQSVWEVSCLGFRGLKISNKLPALCSTLWAVSHRCHCEVDNRRE